MPRRRPARLDEHQRLALFAAYREMRALYRPAKCKRRGKCWVELGPLGLGPRGTCLECCQKPEATPQLERR
jgi:hypothetical protein